MLKYLLTFVSCDRNNKLEKTDSDSYDFDVLDAEY